MNVPVPKGDQFPYETNMILCLSYVTNALLRSAPIIFPQKARRTHNAQEQHIK